MALHFAVKYAMMRLQYLGKKDFIMARQYAAVDKNSRAYKQQQVASARSSLMLVLILTLVNVGMILANSDMFFLLSAFVPYVLVIYGRSMDAGVFGSNTAVSLVIAGVIVAVLLLCWLLSKKKPLFMTISAVLLVLDTVALVYFAFVMMDNPTSQIVNIGLHIFVVYSLIQGSIQSSKLKKETEDDFDNQVASSPEIEF